jgi:hypothetical protein
MQLLCSVVSFDVPAFPVPESTLGVACIKLHGGIDKSYFHSSWRLLQSRWRAKTHQYDPTHPRRSRLGSSELHTCSTTQSTAMELATIDSLVSAEDEFSGGSAKDRIDFLSTVCAIVSSPLHEL